MDQDSDNDQVVDDAFADEDGEDGDGDADDAFAHDFFHSQADKAWEEER